MRPIFNGNVQDDNDPFPPKERPSMLPQKKKQMAPLNNINRISLANRPSLSFSNRTSIQNRLSIANFGQKQIVSAVKKNGNTLNNENRIKSGITDTQSRLKETPINRKPLAAINESPLIKKRVDFELQNYNAAEENQTCSNDSIFTQLERERKIEKFENELHVVFGTFQSSHEDTNSKLALDGQAYTELKQLFDLSEKLAIKKMGFGVRHEHLQDARYNFLQTLTKYENHLKAEVSEVREMIIKYNELRDRIERVQSNQTEYVKPVMVDKEIQAIPERIVFKSPSDDNLANMRSLALMMPASPVLRKSTKKAQSQNIESIKGYRLDFN